MRNILFAFLMIFLVSCGRNTIDEENVCFSKTDCLSGNECMFNSDLNKDYGKCTKIELCNAERECFGDLICNNENKCVSQSFAITSNILDTANRGIDYSYKILFIGLKEENYYFEEVDSLPEGLSLSEDGIITGIPTLMGEFTFKVRLYGHSKENNIYFNSKFTEKLLSITIAGDICDPNPCDDLKKTKCIEDTTNEQGYRCECDDGYLLEGNTCVIDLCKTPSNPCVEQNRTTCTLISENTEYECSCNKGYYENELGECLLDHCNAEVNPCTEENRTNCINDENEANGFKCECNDGLIEYEGVCIENVCSINPCTDSLKNKCVIDLTSETNYRCECKDLFYEDENGACFYDYCEVQKPCDANITTYKTKCVNDGNNYTCECADRYDVDENGNCFFNPCKINHCRDPYKSTCVATGNTEQDYECLCDEGYALNSNNACYPIGDLCETAIEIAPDTVYNGDTTLMHSDYVATCGSYARSKDSVYKVVLTENKLLTATLTPNETLPYNATLHIKNSCESNSLEMGCTDKDGDNVNPAKLENIYLEAGTYYIFADGYAVTNSGAFTLNYELNDPCYLDTDCSSDDTTFCDLDTHTCKENKCLNDTLLCSNGVCNKLDATCKCDEGFLNSDNFTCIEDPCFNTICTENSTCSVNDDLLDYTCKCDANFIKTNSGLCLQNPCIPTNTCTELNKTKCSYNILDDSIETVCSCKDNYIEENGVCIPTIADSCPGVTLPSGITLTGNTTNLHNYYTSSSGYSGTGPEAVYNFTLTKRSHVKILMNHTTITWDKYLHLRKHNCLSSDAQIAYSDSGAEKIEKDLDPDTYYIFADGYTTSSKGEFSISLDIQVLCTSNSDCTGDNQACNVGSGLCECEYGFGFNENLECKEKCMEISQEYYCSDSLYECNRNDLLCYKRTECLPNCEINSHCNLDNLVCDCDEGFTKNENGECVIDLCIENSISCNGDFVSCNGLTGQCICDEGYENYVDGLGCTEDNDPCTPNINCSEANKSICNPLSQTDYECLCNDGFIEDSNNNCIDNPCEPNPCGSNSICNLDSNLHSTCSCKEGFEYNQNNLCEEILGNSCNSPKVISLNDFSDNISEMLSNSQTLTCEAGTENKDRVYQFTLDSDTTLSIDLITSDFNYVLALSKGCNDTFTELTCNNNFSNLNLTSGTYYLHVKSDNIGSFNIDFTISESLYLKNNTLKDAVLNKTYNEEIIIKGGLPPYQIELKLGETLPLGLTLSGNYISGTPTEVTTENNSFVILVTDANNIPKEFTINLLVVDNSIALKPKTGDLLINEIYYRVNSDANNDGIIDIYGDEFIEIANVSYKNLTLEGLSIWDSLDYSYRHNFSGTLQPGSVIVIFGGDVSSLSENNVIFVASTSGNLSLKNDTDMVRIVDENNNIIESVTYTDNNVIGSINRNPDLTNSEFSTHTEVSNSSISLFSPGKKANGDSF